MRIATVLSQRALADGAPRRSGGLVHDVVVVERGQVGQLDDDARPGRRLGASGSPNCAASSDEQRAEPLAAGVDQVARGLGDERVVARDGLVQRASTVVEPGRAAAPRAPESTCDSPKRQASLSGVVSATSRSSADEDARPASTRSSTGCGHDAEHEGDARRRP